MLSQNIHLINIAVPFREGFANMKRPPSGILYVGGYLKKHSFNVTIHHILKHEIEHAVQQIASDSSLLFVGFSVMTGKQITYSAEMSSLLKSVNPKSTIVWGGIHPSLMPYECLAFSFLDYVVIGEGESTAVELAQCLSGETAQPPHERVHQIHGLGFKADNTPFLTPKRAFEKELDRFRQDWSLVNLDRYVRPYWKGEKTFYFITSRGCPHSCGFCYNQEFNRRTWRGHSAQFVIKELRDIQTRTGIETVCFDDDNFFTNKKRSLEILHGLKKYDISCRWVELRVDDITEELISELVALGVETIFIGWESGSQKTLDRISKKLTPQMILEKTRLLSKFPILTIDASSVIGFPWEDKQDIDATLAIALHMFTIKPFKLNFNIGIYLPYPGAPITGEAEKAGVVFPKTPEGWAKFDMLSGEMELPWITNSQIKRYTLIDKYFKLLYVFPFLTFPIKPIAYIIAVLAYIRLKTKFFWFPFEVWGTDLVKKRMYKKLEKGTSIKTTC